MAEEKWDDKEKDRITQEIYDLLEMQKWGEGFDRVVIKLIFKGKFNMMDPEIDQRIKRKSFL